MTIIKQVFISIPKLIKWFSYFFFGEGGDFSFKRGCSLRKEKTSLKIFVAFHLGHEYILT